MLKSLNDPCVLVPKRENVSVLEHFMVKSLVLKSVYKNLYALSFC